MRSSLIVVLNFILVSVSAEDWAGQTTVYRDIPVQPLVRTCFENSVSSPFWQIDNVVFGCGNARDISFNLTNTWGGAAQQCTATPAREDPKILTGLCAVGTDEKVATFKLDMDTGDLQLSQSWTCTDNSANIPVNFVGAGKAKIVPKCPNKTPAFRVLTSLLEPIPYTPPLTSPPPGHQLPGCTQRSQSPSWQVNYFEWWTGGYEQLNIGMQVATSVEPAVLVKATITNEATMHTVSCRQNGGSNALANLTGTVSEQAVRQEYLTTGWWECNPDNPDRNYAIQTFIKLHAENRSLSIGQAWYCDDEDQGKPLQFIGAGVAVLPELQCEKRTILGELEVYYPQFVPMPAPMPPVKYAPDTPIVNGSICKTNATFPGSGTSPTILAMEPFALQLPNAMQQNSGCTLSALDPDKQFWAIDKYYGLDWWYYYNATTNVDSKGEGIGGLTFLFFDADRKRGTRCTAWEEWDSRLNPTSRYYDSEAWFNCEPLWEGMWWRTLQVQWKPDEKRVTLNASWACDDKTPGHPIVFSTLSTGLIDDLSCSNTTQWTGDQLTSCSWGHWVDGRAVLSHTNKSMQME